jgi:hypothetical protein
MSADNGIYIGRFKCGHPIESCKDDGFEYRVIHAQAIENCDYDSDCPTYITDSYRVDYYGGADVCYTEKEAWEQARTMEKENAESDYPVLEYGVSEIHYDVPFPTMTKDQARDVQAKYWGRKDAEREAEQEKEVLVRCLVTKGMFSQEYFVMVQDYPSLTPVVWRGFVDRHSVRLAEGSGTTMEGYHFGFLHAYKVKEEVKTEKWGSGESSKLMYLVEFPGENGKRQWVEPQLVVGKW